MVQQPGPNEIPTEVLKADPDTSVKMLHTLFDTIWEEIPDYWKEGHLIKIPKKGDINLCTSYRGNTLL